MALTGPTRQQVLQLMMAMIRVETCTDPCGLNWSDEAASPAADDDYDQVDLPEHLNLGPCHL